MRRGQAARGRACSDLCAKGGGQALVGGEEGHQGHCQQEGRLERHWDGKGVGLQDGRVSGMGKNETDSIRQPGQQVGFQLTWWLAGHYLHHENCQHARQGLDHQGHDVLTAVIETY